MKPYQKLRRHWDAQGIKVGAGASEAAVREFETNRRLRSSLDLDFREYLLNLNGMPQVGGQDSDDKGFSFWPLSRIRSVPEECEANEISVPRIDDVEKYYGFADYMQWSWAYAIGVGTAGGGKILQFGTRGPRIVALSFREFVDAYLGDSEKLYLPKH